MNMRAWALGALVASLALAGCDRDVTQIVKVNTVTGPSAPECSDGVNNDPWEDDLADILDPDCHTDGNAGNRDSYNRFDNSEARDSGGTPPANGPAAFRQDGGTICSPLDASRAERPIGFSWTSAGAGATYRVEERIPLGAPEEQQWHEVQNGSSLSVRLERRRWSRQHFYRVTATLNGVARLWENGEWQAPCETLADPLPPPPPVTTPAPPSGPGPGGPGPSGPGTGNLIRITGPASFGGGAGATATATAECSTNGGSTWGGCPSPWWFSSDPARIQVNPTSGAMQRNASGSATVCVQWSVSQMSPSDCRTY
jgi:hypothetical protein